jgi:flavin reductase (DIM6/NTAB) family NADH-FMN oxidoreductase RutF
VPADADDLAQLFGGETQDHVDKFARTLWHEGPEGVPILDRCENWFVGRVLRRLDTGDHDAFLLEPIEAGAAPGHEEFSFHRAKRIDPGHEA